MQEISNSTFIQRTMILEGKPWKFYGRPYILTILNRNPKEMLLMTGRQSEKSTTMAGKHITYMCRAHHETSLYVSPTMTQTSVYSRKKIDAVFEMSPILRNTFYSGVRGFSVSEKRLKNGHVGYFRSAYYDADTIRGISSSNTKMDEVQDLDSDVIPVIKECSSHKPNATFMYTGTPKSMSNPIQSMLWEKSTQSEWTIKCMHCGKYNVLSIHNVQIDHPGIWCSKCGRDIVTQNGIWVSMNQTTEIEGYRFPQIILPSCYIDWKELFKKIKNYDTPTLMNEVFGQSWDSGSKPITQPDVFAACSLTRGMLEISPEGTHGYETFAGIDWAAGIANCFTVLTIGFFDPVSNRMKVTFAKRYVGKEADPETMLPDMARIILQNGCRFVGADYGFGFGSNSRLKSMLGPNVNYQTFCHSPSKQYVAWNKKSNTYVLGKTVVLTEVFDLIKKKFFEFPMWSEYTGFARDILNEDIEYNIKTGTMRYCHLPSNPDDALHSLLFLYVFYAIRSKRHAVEQVQAASELDPMTMM